MNWIGILFSFAAPVAVVVGMALVLIRDHVKAKRRERRCHGRVRNWWELRAE